ncbi:MAG TPA: N-acetylmuramoyl-L-alanine amidase, partial [Gemmatimonadales bacterium]|nr:N-acetylmuramoyl-L-alanine amidase [Gemmatimonadales bacterium]
SSFIFGSTGTGDAMLTINGSSIPVAPDGTWLAWVPFRGDSVIRFEIEARTPLDSARLRWPVRRYGRGFTAPDSGVWIDTTSFRPAGRVWWPADEALPISVAASEGAALTLILPDGERLPLRGATAPRSVSEGVRAFSLDTAALGGTARETRYRAVLRGRAIGRSLGAVLAPDSGAPAAPVRRAVVEAVRGADTARAEWPLALSLLQGPTPTAELDDDLLRRGNTDGITVGRATPEATYHWFFPAGTRAAVTARVNGVLRLGVSAGAAAWVAAAEAREAEPGSGPATIGSVWTRPSGDRVVVRIPVGERRPFQVSEEEREIRLLIYGAVSDINWTRYGADDSLVRVVSWSQVRADEVELRFLLSQPVWGFRTRWEGTDLLLEIRRPPAIDVRSPLAGRTIVLDPGHPPAGATGVSGLSEAEANLGVAEALRPLLEQEGARVLMTRSGGEPLDLWPRVRFADSVDADALVSIHNNALPDGVNPFTSNGSSVFYNHPRAIPLARAIQRRLVAWLGTRDLGISRGDLALTRPTWMPAVLTEGLFMMVPEQEAALRSEQGRGQYARAVLEGLREFFRSRAGSR